jgi:phosphatidylethanolamine-binding protein (PEBP) family uncharacterized protein
MRAIIILVAASFVSAVVLSACGGSDDPVTTLTTETLTTETFTLSTTAFVSGDAIPVEYTCYGAGVSSGIKLPDISWGALPTGTKSIFIVMDDLDASSHNSGNAFVHYVAYIPVDQLAQSPLVEVNTLMETDFPYQKTTTFSEVSDLAPCNPDYEIHTHTYTWKAYALDTDIANIPEAAAIEAKFETAITNQASTYLKDNNGVPYITRAIADKIFVGNALATGTFIGKMDSSIVYWTGPV